jgi:hypothetical protein
MEQKYDNIKISIHKKMERIQKSIIIRDFNTSVNLMISVYEEAFKVLYKTYLGQLHNPKSVLDCINEISKSCSIDELMFGSFIALFNKTDFIEEVAGILNDARPFGKKEFLKDLNELNRMRVSDVHAVNSAPVNIEEEYINLKYNYLKLFLKMFGLNAEVSLPIEYGTLRTQKITGEIQLYRSLNEVLYKEGVDCLDATYFSAKLPQKQKYEEVQNYWSEVNRKVGKQEMVLRRIISTSDEDVKRLKLLWILFDQVPTYYDVLNKSVFLSIFNTSRINTYKEISKAVNLINIIIMYNKETPNKGHVWLFSSHPEIHVSEREYLHIYGDNISTLRNIFNDMYNSSDQCDVDLIKKLISQNSKNETDINRIYEIIDRAAAQSEFIFPPSETDNIKSVYASIYAGKEDDVEEFIF